MGGPGDGAGVRSGGCTQEELEEDSRRREDRPHVLKAPTRTTREPSITCQALCQTWRGTGHPVVLTYRPRRVGGRGGRKQLPWEGR